MRWHLAVVAAALLLAGCGSLFAADDRPGDATTDTITPAPVPEITPTPDEWALAPGLSSRGVENRSALVAAHRAATANRSYVWRERRGVAADLDGAVPLFDHTVACVESDTVYRIWTAEERVRLLSGVRTVANYTEYADGEDRIVRYRFPGRTDYDRERRSPVGPADHRFVGDSAAGAVDRYLAVANATVSAVRIDGERHYRVVGENWTRVAGDDVSNFTVTAVVSPDGLVRSLEASYTVRSLDRPQRVRYAFAYEDLDETTVDPPAWYDGGG